MKPHHLLHVSGTGPWAAASRCSASEINVWLYDSKSDAEQALAIMDEKGCVDRVRCCKEHTYFYIPALDQHAHQDPLERSEMIAPKGDG
jgi:hypothetical protein